MNHQKYILRQITSLQLSFPTTHFARIRSRALARRCSALVTSPPPYRSAVISGDVTLWHLDRVLETLLGHMLQEHQGMVNLRSTQKAACLPKSSLEAEDKGVNHHTKWAKLGGISEKSVTLRGFLLEKRHQKSIIFNSLNTLMVLPPLSALLPSLHYPQFRSWFQVQRLILPFIVGKIHQRMRACLSWLAKCFLLQQAKI